MQLLKDRIRKDGVIKDGNVLKVDSFLNHQMDIALINEMGKEFRRRFPDESINKILTIEASGIGIACITCLLYTSSQQRAAASQHYAGLDDIGRKLRGLSLIHISTALRRPHCTI